jgi:hypothetical protein
MKIMYFVKWLSSNFAKQVKGFDRWMWGWVATCFFASMYFSAEKGGPTEDFAGIGLSVMFIGFWFLYGVVYTGIKTAWRKFNEEQNKMLDHLKDMG